MEFFMLLSVQILIAGIVVMFFTKNEHQTKIRAIFWLMSLITLCPPVIANILTGTTFLGYFAAKILGQTAFLNITPVSGFFLFITIIFSIFYVLYGMKSDRTNSENSIYSTLLLTSVLFIFMLDNMIFSYTALSTACFAAYKLLTADEQNPNIFKNTNGFFTTLFIAGTLIVISLIILLSAGESLNYTNYLQILAKNKDLSSSIYLMVLAGFSLPLLAILKSNNDNCKSSETLLFLPVIAIITSAYGITKFISISAVPATLLSGYLSLLLLISAILFSVWSWLSKNLSEKKSLLSISSILFILGILNLAMIGVAYSIPALAIIGLISFFVLLVNNILAHCLLLADSDNCKAVSLFSYCFAPFTCGFTGVIAVLYAIILIFIVKSCNFFILFDFILIIGFIILNIFCAKNLYKSFVSEQNNNTFEIRKSFVSIILGIITVLSGIFISFTTRLAILPASTIISGKTYNDIYAALIDIFGILQWVYIILFSAVLIYFGIKKFIDLKSK